jgi:hypothetical protein
VTPNPEGDIVMRKRVFFIILPPLALLTLGLAYGALRAAEQGGKDATEDRVIGTWKLVSAKYGGEESDVAKQATTLKHVTQTGFVWLSYDPETKVVSRTAGGTYTLKGDRYEETPQYGFGDDFNIIRDKPQPFTLKIEGDRWHHSGTLSNGLKIEEVWERSKKQ